MKMLQNLINSVIKYKHSCCLYRVTKLRFLSHYKLARGNYKKKGDGVEISVSSPSSTQQNHHGALISLWQIYPTKTCLFILMTNSKDPLVMEQVSLPI